MPATEIILGLLSVLIGWFWLDSLKVREAAIAAARAACEAEALMLLDDTVAIAALKPVRDETGHIMLQRTYNFEYSDTGDNRRTGSLVMQRRRVVLFNVGVRDSAANRMS